MYGEEQGRKEKKPQMGPDGRRYGFNSESVFICMHLWLNLRGFAVKSFLALCLLALPTIGSAQEVYTTFKERDKIEAFTRVSTRLVCQCGCHMVLSTCPHVECPWAIPSRRFIENRINSGMSADEIIAGFEKGFGKSIESDSIVQQMLASGRTEMVEGFVTGFGRSVRAESSSLTTLVFMTLSIIFGCAVGWFWWQRNRRIKGADSASTASAASNATLDDTIERIRKLEK